MAASIRINTFHCKRCEAPFATVDADDEGRVYVTTEEGAIIFGQDEDSGPYVDRAIQGMKRLCDAGRCKARRQLN